jgi:hypothetical protein
MASLDRGFGSGPRVEKDGGATVERDPSARAPGHMIREEAFRMDPNENLR